MFCFGCGDAGDRDVDARFVWGRPRSMCRTKSRRAFPDGGWDGNKQTVRRSSARRNLLHGWKGIFFRPSAAGLVASNRILGGRFHPEGCCPLPPVTETVRNIPFHPAFGLVEIPPCPPLPFEGWGERGASFLSDRTRCCFHRVRTETGMGSDPSVRPRLVPGTPRASSPATCPMDSHPPFPVGNDGSREKEANQGQTRGWRGVSIEIRPLLQPGGTGLYVTPNANRMAESQSTHHRTAAPTIRSSGTCVKTTVQV